MTPPTLKDLVEFVLENKKDKTFIDMTTMRIINLLQAGVQEGTMLYHQDSTGKIVGMILAEKREEEKILFVTENLSMNLNTLKEFAKIAKQRWPDYTLQWLKRGIHKHHSTQRTYEHLSLR